MENCDKINKNNFHTLFVCCTNCTALFFFNLPFMFFYISFQLIHYHFSFLFMIMIFSFYDDYFKCCKAH